MVMLKPILVHRAFELLNRITSGNLPPFPAVCAVIESDGNILLIDRSDGLGLSLPGGIVKWGETLEEALRREVEEETGYQVSITRLVGIYSGPYRDPRASSVQIAYAATIINGQVRSSHEGIVVWTPKESLPNILAFDHTAVVTDYLSGEVKI